MAIEYEKDFAGWAKEQAFWLRTGQLSLADALHVAEEIEGVGSGVEYQLADRCSTLLAHLCRWQKQEGNRCELWRHLIGLQRQRISRMVKRMPSLQETCADPEFLRDVWLDALIKVTGENACDDLPEASPWTLAQALAPDFYPQNASSPPLE
jgi:hypothetical protein